MEAYAGRMKKHLSFLPVTDAERRAIVAASRTKHSIAREDERGLKSAHNQALLGAGRPMVVADQHGTHAGKKLVITERETIAMSGDFGRVFTVYLNTKFDGSPFTFGDFCKELRRKATAGVTAKLAAKVAAKEAAKKERGAKGGKSAKGCKSDKSAKGGKSAKGRRMH